MKYPLCLLTPNKQVICYEEIQSNSLSQLAAIHQLHLSYYIMSSVIIPQTPTPHTSIYTLLVIKTRILVSIQYKAYAHLPH